MSPDTIDFLYEKVLPQLEQTLMACDDDLDETPRNEDSYLLSDIFCDINEDEDVEEDENEEDNNKGEEETTQE